MHSRRRRALAVPTLAAAVALVAGAMLPGVAAATARGQRADPVVALEPVSPIAETTAMAVRPGDPALYVTTQRGLVLAIDPERDEPRTVLDLTALTRGAQEQGLLGIDFSPEGDRLSVHYTGIPSGETVIAEYEFADGVADRASRRVLLTVPQPQGNHNGGQLAFGPDGHLYLGLGDGGARDDRGIGHAPEGNGQSLDTLLGKVLRIDPRPSGGMPYTVPDDNPYADGGGRPEIYVSGLRNPWRFSFDAKNGDLWIADVGQNEFEEATRLRAGEIAGANLGWNVFEGTNRFRDGSADGLVMPQIVTSHDDGNCSITGGYVYRGREIAGLRGWYLYTDYCNGAIKAARVNKAGELRERELGVSLPAVSSFGEGDDGEIYVLSQREGVYRIVPG